MKIAQTDPPTVEKLAARRSAVAAPRHRARAARKQPDKRFQTGEEFAQALIGVARELKEEERKKAGTGAVAVGVRWAGIMAAIVAVTMTLTADDPLPAPVRGDARAGQGLRRLAREVHGDAERGAAARRGLRGDRRLRPGDDGAAGLPVPDRRRRRRRRCAGATIPSRSAQKYAPPGGEARSPRATPRSPCSTHELASAQRAGFRRADPVPEEADRPRAPRHLRGAARARREPGLRAAGDPDAGDGRRGRGRHLPARPPADRRADPGAQERARRARRTAATTCASARSARTSSASSTARSTRRAEALEARHDPATRAGGTRRRPGRRARRHVAAATDAVARDVAGGRRAGGARRSAACAEAPQRPPSPAPVPTIFAPVETGPVLARDAQFVVVVPRQGEDLASLAERYLGDRSRALRDRRVQPDRRGARRAAPSRSRSRRSIRAASSRRACQTVPILCYHRFGPRAEQPDRHAGGVRGADALSARERLHGGADDRGSPAFLEGKSALPRKSVVITIDDGYRSTYDVAWPILQALRLPGDRVPVHRFRRRAGDALTWAQMKEMTASGSGRHPAAQQDAREPDDAARRRERRPLPRPHPPRGRRADRRDPRAARRADRLATRSRTATSTTSSSSTCAPRA